MTMEFCLEHIGKTYYDAAGRETVALVDVTERVAPGEFVALLGPSGCGKSTLLHIAAGLTRPTSGEVFWRGAERIPRTAMVFQDAALFPWLSVRDNIAFGIRESGLGAAAIRERVEEQLALMQLTDFADHYPQALSGGMRQRAGIARAWATEAELLLMDEPFSALDAQTRRLLEEELARYWEALRPATMYVTHNIGEAVRLADTVWVFSRRPGRILRRVTVAIPRAERRAPAQQERLAAYEEEIWELIKEDVREALSEGGRHA